MDLKEKINGYLSSFGGFVLDKDESCIIEHDSGVQFSVHVPEGVEFVTFYAPLTEVPIENPAQILRRALTLNLFQNQTRGGSIAYDPSNGWLVLSLSVDGEALDEVKFTNSMSNVVDVAQELRRSLKEFLSSLDSTAEAEGDEKTAQTSPDPLLRV